jgi:hypothetical protein
MKNVNAPKLAQFRQCQATIATFTGEGGNYTIFYSYTCPKIVVFPNGETKKFTFDGSRKAGSITSSITTSKQCNKRLGGDHHKLEPVNLADFEANYFDTRLERYY